MREQNSIIIREIFPLVWFDGYTSIDAYIDIQTHCEAFTVYLKREINSSMWYVLCITEKDDEECRIKENEYEMWLNYILCSIGHTLDVIADITKKELLEILEAK